jgi:uncharacterized protein (DUF342 family)
MDNNKSISLSNSNDARVVVRFSDDDIKVYADFMPSSKDGKPLTEYSVLTVLDKMGVRSGFLNDSIKDAVERCNATHRPLKDILIARGELPVDETPSYYEIDPILLKPPRPEFKEGAQTDYRAWSPFIIVRKNQVLAKRREAIVGMTGRTVHGKEVTYKTIQKQLMQGGKNTQATEENIVSQIDGLFLLQGAVMNVEPKLVLKGPVSYETGNINFPNDVEMPGAVNEGFKITVGNNLIVKDTLDVTDVIVRNDLKVAGGMIGRGRALVKTSGSIEARFIQNCRVACKKEIKVKNDVINSTIYTMDALDISNNGTLLGGEVFAFNLVRAGRIGKEHANPVKIHIGIDWTIAQDIESNENMMRVIDAKLEKVRGYLQTPDLSEGQLTKVEDMRSRLETESAKCIKKQEELNKRFIIGTDAALECIGQIAAGTMIEICKVEYLVSKPISRVRLVLDRQTGRIIPLPLVKSA